MVTINTAKYLLIGLIVLALASFSVAADRLEFSDVEVKVDGEKSDNLDDGDRIGDEARPGDKITIKVKIESNFSSSDKDSDGDEIEIQDIEVTATLEGVDDGDDMDDSIDYDDLKGGDDDSGTFEFTLPEDIGEGDYDLVLNAEGEDTNGTNHEVEITLTLEVEKEDHEVRITRVQLSPEQARCSQSVTLGITVLNTGQEDEDDNVLTVTNSELGISFSDTFDVQEGEFDDDMKFSKTYTFSVPKDADEGTYPILVRSTFDEGDDSVVETANLVIGSCTAAAADDEETTSTPSSDDDDNGSTSKPSTSTGTTTVVVSPGAQATSTTADVIQPTTSTATSEPQSLFDSPAFLVGVVVIEVLIVIVGIAFVAYLMRRN